MSERRRSPDFAAGAFIFIGIVFIGVLVLVVALSPSARASSDAACPFFTETDRDVQVITTQCRPTDIAGTCTLGAGTRICTYLGNAGGPTAESEVSRKCTVSSNNCVPGGGAGVCTCIGVAQCIRTVTFGPSSISMEFLCTEEDD